MQQKWLKNKTKNGPKSKKNIVHVVYDRPQRTFGQNNQNSNSQYQKVKKFPWDIFGIFGYKNVIRPNRPSRPNFRPTPTGRPPYFPSTTSWPNNCNCWTISNSPTGGPVIVASNVGNPQQPGHTRILFPSEHSIYLTRIFVRPT